MKSVYLTLMNTHTKKHVTCAGCIVYRSVTSSVEVLLIKPRYDSHEWGIPKGHIDPGESIFDCAIRETYEETGIMCMPEHCLEPVNTVNNKEYKRLHAFIARHVGNTDPDPVMKQEVADVRWFSIHTLPKIHRYQVPLVQQAVSMLVNMQDAPQQV